MAKSTQKTAEKHQFEWNELTEQIPPERYTELLHQVELDAIVITECSAKVRGNPDDGEVVLTSIREAALAKIEDGIASFHVKYKLTGQYKKATILSFLADYEVTLLIHGDVPEAFFHLYAQMNLPLHTYPFFREWVSSTSARMPISPIVMPLMKPATSA